MIDLKNEGIKNFIESNKKLLEQEVLKYFKINVIPLYAGEPKNGEYVIVLDCFAKEGEFRISKDFHIATQVFIGEELYKNMYKKKEEKV